MNFLGKLLILICLFLYLSCSNSNKCEEKRKSKNISFNDFNYDFNLLMYKICNGVLLDTSEKLKTVKIMNSNQFYALNIDSTSPFLWDIFINYIRDSVIIPFRFEFGIGMSMYSRKFNISAGGLQFHESSYIPIDSSSLPIQSKIRVREFIGNLDTNYLYHYKDLVQ